MHYCCSSVAESCLSLCNSMNSSTTGFLVLHSLLEFSNSCPLKHPTISFSVAPFSSCSQSLPASESFPVSRPFSSGGQSIRASASILSINIQGGFPFGFTGLISLLPKGLSRVFSRTRVLSINSLVLSLLYGPTLTSIHDYWKNDSFDYMDFCQWSGISAFNTVWVHHSFSSKEQVSFNFMAAVTMHSNFGAQENKNKVCYSFHCFPIYLPWSYGTRCHYLSFFGEF